LISLRESFVGEKKLGRILGKMGRMQGRQAETMPMQGSAEDQMVASTDSPVGDRRLVFSRREVKEGEGAYRVGRSL